MDGGRRLLRSLREAFGAFVPAGPALAGAGDGYRAAASFEMPRSAAAPRPFARSRRRNRAENTTRFVSIARAHGVGLALAIVFLGGAGLIGAIHGGQYARFIAENGAIGDVAARSVGLGIDAITITGTRELLESEILQDAGVTTKNSLLFLDVNDVRERLRAIPLVRDASVRKLFPNRLIIDIAEREPFAIWQKDGALNLVAADGAPVAEMRDARFADLPFVVGEGANRRIKEFMKIVEAAGDFRGRIRAGVLVGQRRWNLKLSTGLEVKLPEEAPEFAAAQLGRLARDSRLLDKDLVYVDLRIPGKMFARLSEEAATTRADNLPKFKKRGPQ
jgi:cell division protein FtsQ